MNVDSSWNKMPLCELGSCREIAVALLWLEKMGVIVDTCGGHTQTQFYTHLLKVRKESSLANG